MKTFEYLMPTRILFGNGQIRKVGIEAKELGHRALVITGKRAMRSYGILERVAGYLESAGIDHVIFDKISPNPKVTEVDEGIDYARKHQCDIVVGLGGGSAIDAAKGVAMVANYGESIRDYLVGNAIIGEESLPMISIPTTAGTGAEVTNGAIISDMQRRIKRKVEGKGTFPKLAIVDAELSLSLPGNITRETGFDVLCHAIETYVSKKAGPITALFSKEAVRIVFQNLKDVVRDGSNLEARTNMMYASLLMGFNLTNSSTCLPHRLQYPIGAHTDTSHGMGLASLFPVWLEGLAPLVPKKFAKIAELLGADVIGLSELEAAKRGVEIIDAFLKDMGLSIRLRDLGISLQECSRLASEVYGNLEVDPGFQSREDVLKLYRAAW